MKVKIKKLHPDAVIPYKTYSDDFCYDCVAVSCQEVAPNVYKYGLGFALQIDRDKGEPIVTYMKWADRDNRVPKQTDMTALQLSIDFRPRSSVWKTGMVLSNCEGTVDESYTGEISAVFYHVMPNMPRYKVGDRIGQIKLGFTLPIEFVDVDELDETKRGANAYGSTGN